MKAINKICRFSAIIFGLASVVLFFTKFATIFVNKIAVPVVGAQLAFGSEVEVTTGYVFPMHKSAHIFACFVLAVAAAAASFFAMKYKKGRYTASAVGLGATIYMLVVALSHPTNMIDKRPLPNVTAIEYSMFVWLIVAALFLFTVASIAHLLIDDYLEVKAADDGRLTIPKRVVRFFRDYKSETKKIVWPGPKDVVKSTLVVIVMCLLVGVLIWAVDFGLGKLLDVVLGI